MSDLYISLKQVYAICVDEAPFLLVTEYLPHGDMKNYLKKTEAKENLTFDKLVRISENVSDIFSVTGHLQTEHITFAPSPENEVFCVRK